MFFGIGMSEDKNQRISTFDDSQCNVMVFNEIYFAIVRMLAKNKRYSEENPDKIIIATSDTNQLECMDLISDQIKYDQYMEHCIDTIFENNIYLTENKRLTNEADKKLLKRIKADIFDPKKSINKTIKTYFKLTKKIETTNNIAYKSSTCNIVSSKVRDILKKSDDYEVGGVLICRKFVKVKKSKLHLNFEYEIENVEGDNVTLYDVFETAVTLSKDIKSKQFTYA